MDRRIFLKSSGLALVSYGVLPKFLVRAAYAEGEAARRKKALVVVFQRGACDGLNTVIPYGDPLYRSLRPTIAVPAPRGDDKSALDLDGTSACTPRSSHCCRSGARAASRRCTRSAAPTRRARTSKRRTSWRAARPAGNRPTTAG